MKGKTILSKRMTVMRIQRMTVSIIHLNSLPRMHIHRHAMKRNILARQQTLNRQEHITSKERNRKDWYSRGRIQARLSCWTGMRLQRNWKILGGNLVLPPLSPPSRDSHSENEQVQELPRRERRRPKLFTYNDFGNLVCYSMGPPARPMYRFNPMQHYRVHQPGTMWADSVQHPTYQPVPLHG